MGECAEAMALNEIDAEVARDDVAIVASLLAITGHPEARATARALLRRFHTIGRMLAARPAQLARCGVGESAQAAFRSVHEVAVALTREEIVGRPVLSAWDKVVAYVRAELGHGGTERFFVLFLDRRNGLIAAEELGRGTVDHAPVYPREIVRRALELESSALILCHNHPSGDATPSRADIEMTRAVAKACAALEIALRDHLIVAPGGHSSLRALGLM